MAKVEYIEPGIDPTAEEYEPTGFTGRGCAIILGCIVLFLFGSCGAINFVRARQGTTPTPVPTFAPTNTATVTNTPEATSTGTVTPRPPTATPKPSETPRPTATLAPRELPKRIITATLYITPPSILTATSLADGQKVLDAQRDLTRTPVPFLEIRKTDIAAGKATARAYRPPPTETPAG